jgi:low affinity Fe/Cu permease
LNTGITMDERFRQFAQKTSNAAGSSWAFLLALLIIIVWLISGPFFHYSALWQLIINTGTTIITFLMIFLVQNAQNRETKATQLKLDELIRAQKRANNKLMGIETKSDKQLEQATKGEMKQSPGQKKQRT